MGSGAIARAADKFDNQPFFGASTGTSTSTASDMSGNQFDSASTGTLNATHVGNSKYTITAHQDYARHVEEEHPDGNCAFVEDGKTGQGLVITAANGDQIFGNIDDDRSVVCAPDNQGIMPVPGDQYLSTLYINVVGGTGRFTSATGWLFVHGTSTLTTLTATGANFNDTGTFLGDIKY
jgi:hypothetical protein